MTPSARNNKRKVIIFGHIPKTAGSTIKTILWRQYSSASVFFSMTPALHRARFAELRDRLEEGRDPVHAVVTHAGYGLHEMMPDTYDYPYFTFLREPIDRVISGYFMFLRQGKVPSDTSLEEFVRTMLKPGCNMQTSYLSGHFLQNHMEGRMPEWEDFDERMLDQAKANLERHVVVGLTERFDETLLLLQQAFGWRWHRLLYARTNVGKNRQPKDQFTRETLRVVEAYNELDIALYDYAKHLFEARIEAMQDEMPRRIERFKSMNKVYAATVPPVLNALRPVVDAVRGKSTAT